MPGLVEPKHIAAVYYLLVEEFDRDPFLIFKLRGMTREDLVGLPARRVPHRSAPDDAAGARDDPGGIRTAIRPAAGGERVHRLGGVGWLPPYRRALSDSRSRRYFSA